jgi:hypothetical protein
MKKWPNEIVMMTQQTVEPNPWKRRRWSRYEPHVIKPVHDTCYELALGNMSRIKMCAALQVHTANVGVNTPEHRTGNEKHLYADTPIMPLWTASKCKDLFRHKVSLFSRCTPQNANHHHMTHPLNYFHSWAVNGGSDLALFSLQLWATVSTSFTLAQNSQVTCSVTITRLSKFLPGHYTSSQDYYTM